MATFKISEHFSYKMTTEKKYNDDHPDLTGPNTNTISYGLYEENGTLINNHIINTKNNQLTKVFSISHYINENRKYLLLVLNDFKQSQFEVSGRSYFSYEFSMQPNTTKAIPINIEITDNTKEVDFVLIKNPDFLLKKDDIKLASLLQEVICLRYSINQPIKKVKEIEYEDPLKIYVKGPNDNVFISNSIEQLKIVYEGISSESMYLHVGNISQEPMDYALISFLDWKQVPLLDNMVSYVSVKPDTRKVFNLELPSTNEEKNYQILAFPMPFRVSDDNFHSQMIYGTLRTIINNQ